MKLNEVTRYNLFLKKALSFWQLACILIVPLTLPNIILGGTLYRTLPPGTIIPSICLGNLILWLIGIGIISMSYRDRVNAIDNAKRYIGKLGGISVALVFMFAFLIWFLIQINEATKPIISLFPNTVGLEKGDLFIRFGAAAGLLISLLAIGGIRMIKWINVIAFPFVIAFHIFAIISSSNPPQFNGTWALSFSAVIHTIMMPLPGVINYPTFFRYSRSLGDSFLALTMIMAFITFFQISGMWMNFDPFTHLSFAKYAGTSLFSISVLIGFVLLILVCGNLVNLYFASASWETIIPPLGKQKEYTIIGLVGTAAYTFIQISQPMLYILILIKCFIGTLGIVLLISFIIRIVARHRFRPFEKFINGISWFFGCLTAFIALVKKWGLEDEILLLSIGISSLFYLVVIFIEENLWSLGHLIFIQKIIRIARGFFKSNKTEKH